MPAPTDRHYPWIVVQHTATEGPGLLAGVLAEAGASVRVVRLDLGEVLPAPSEVAGVVVMGGPMGVHDTAEHPWIASEQRWLAAGGRRRASRHGRLPGGPAARLRPGGAGDHRPRARGRHRSGRPRRRGPGRPVLGPEGECLSVVHWHGDTFAIPDGAVRLASSDRYRNQAFRYGDRVYGLQFHLEVDDEVAAGWAPDLPAGHLAGRTRARGGGGGRPPRLRSFPRARLVHARGARARGALARFVRARGGPDTGRGTGHAPRLILPLRAVRANVMLTRPIPASRGQTLHQCPETPTRGDEGPERRRGRR